MALENNCQHLTEGLHDLEVLIDLLPPVIPLGTSDGPFAKYFSDLSINQEEGPYYSFNWAWNHVLQVPNADRVQLITRSEYGINLLFRFFKFFSTALGIEATTDYFSLQRNSMC